MNTLLTALSTVGVILTCVAAFVAVRAADRASTPARRLGVLRGRVLEIDGALEQLANQHRKLQGRFYGVLGARATQFEHEGLDIPRSPPLDVPPPKGPACANWAAACLDGPKSEAAKCECGYCASMRVARAALKRQLLPRSNDERLAAIKKGLSQP